MKEYQQLTLGERYHIRRYKQAGKSIRCIAGLLCRTPSTISREFKRNRGKKGYRPEQAERLAESRRWRGGRPVLTVEMASEIESGLREKMTPAIISNRARLEGRRMISHERIYRYVFDDAARGGHLWRLLPRAKRKRWRRLPSRERRGRILNRRMIDERPGEVDARCRIGDWEGDLVQGSRGHLSCLVERLSLYTLLGKVGSKREAAVRRRMKKSLMAVPEDRRITLTLDNGKEFAGHQKLSAAAGIDIYFAHPYHAWERGTNENTNGLIRRWFPKRTDFIKVSDSDVLRVQEWLNHRPRACLGYLTPHEVFVRGMRPGRQVPGTASARRLRP